MNFKPLSDKVLVRREEAEDITKGGIVIPDATRTAPNEGTVVAAGDGLLREDGSVRKTQVKVGDYILFGKYSGTEVRVNDALHLILREDEILGIVTNKWGFDVD